VREVFQKAEPRLQIEIDPDLERVVVKIVRGETNEVIRQIPPQELLDLAKRLAPPKGLLFTERA
jgi:flagellar protein FlaG